MVPFRRDYSIVLGEQVDNFGREIEVDIDLRDAAEFTTVMQDESTLVNTLKVES